MNSGFFSHLTKGKLLNSVGTHQKFDRTAFDLLSPRIEKDKFPPRSLIMKFEGFGGPDGLKFKGSLTDSLTPAHHMSHKYLLEEYENNKYRKRWKVYGHKGLLSSHVAFEAGISSAIIFTPVKVKFDDELLKSIKKDGIKQVVMNESLAISKHKMYEQFLKKGWNAKLAKSVKATVVKRIPQLVAAAWLAAYQEAYKGK